MIDAGEDEVSRGIGRGGIVIYRFKTIFAHKNRATGEVKLKLLVKRVLNTVLKICGRRGSGRSGRRGKVLNALERVAGYRAKSQKPVVSKRKNIHCVEKRGAHVLRADVGCETRFVLVSAVKAGVEGKPAREVMRERHSDVSGSLALARHVEILAKASDTHHKELCPFPGASVSENNVFPREHGTLAARAQGNVVVVAG